MPSLHTLPGDGGSLPFRNLKRGVMLGLPSGQDVAKAMRIQQSADARRDRDRDRMAPSPRSIGLHLQTPLWYYILKEAEQRGQRRAARSGRRDDRRRRCSSASCRATRCRTSGGKGKHWKPTLPSKKPGDFTMADLLRFVGDISPIDGITTV